MKTQKRGLHIFDEKTINKEILMKINGGETSIAYDIGTLGRLTYYGAGVPGEKFYSTLFSWWYYQKD
ncbi:MAG: hypothetical protein MRY51_06635 [Flavobacteriaceae bacterium]|nr:hypothetical protein [Flavobacteriaceae bacterium]MCI5088636.1 hypothetical protein [Flavobacteriaceae bacterium]